MIHFHKTENEILCEHQLESPEEFSSLQKENREEKSMKNQEPKCKVCFKIIV